MSLISGSYSLGPAGGGAEDLRAGMVEKEAIAGILWPAANVLGAIGRRRRARPFWRALPLLLMKGARLMVLVRDDIAFQVLYCYNTHN